MSRCLVAVLISWSATLCAQQPVPLAIPGVCGLVANAADGLLYVATCSGGDFPNNKTTSIIAVDPLTRTQVNSVILPSFTGTLFADRNVVGPVLSSDGKHLYLGRRDLNVIHRFGLPALNLELDIPVRVVGGAQQVVQVRAVPGQPSAIVVVTGSYPGEGVAVYDDAAMRPQTLGDNTCQSAAFGATADVLYCFVWNSTNDYVLRTVRVDSTGLTVTRSMNTFAGYFGGPFFPFEVFGNRIYTAAGAVLDTDSLEQVGRLDFSGSRLSQRSPILIDRENKRVYFSVDQTIWAYDLDRLVPTVEHKIYGSVGSEGPATAFERWGSDGFAVVSSRGLVLLQGSLSPYPDATFAVSRTASGALVLDGPVNNLTYSKADNHIWASIPSKAGSRGNSIVQISPITGQIDKVIPTASEPARLAFTEDGQFLYVSFRCTPEIHRYNLQAQAFDQRIHLRQSTETDKPNIGLIASDFTIMPGADSRLVVSRSIWPPSSGPSNLRISFQSLVVYDNGQPKPNGPFQELQIGILLPPESASKVYGIVVDPYGFTGSIARLQVDSTGVSVVGNRDLGGGGAQFAIKNDVIYSSAGVAFQFDSPLRVGVFPSGDSTSVALNGPGTLAYFFSVTYSSSNVATWMLTAFSTETFLSLATVDLGTWSGPAGSTMIATPDETFAVATEKKLFIVAGRLLKPVPAYYATSQPVANGITRLPLVANSLAFDKARGQLVASVSSVSPGTGNSIATIDPQTGAVRYSSFVGSEPTAIGVSDDGSVLHVSFAGELRLARFGYPALTNKATVPFAKADIVDELHVAPGTQERIVTSGNELSISSFMFFDHLKKLEYFRLPDSLGDPTTGTFGKDASTFYGYDLWGGGGHWRIAVDATSAKELSRSALAVGYFNTYVYDGGLVYDASGLVIDPERAQTIGKFEHPALVQQVNGSWTRWVRPLPDSASGRMYYVVTDSGGGQARILVFDQRTHAQLGEMSVPQASGAARDFLKCGGDCLAFRTTRGEIFVISTSSIPLHAPTAPADPAAQLRSTAGVYESLLVANDLAFDSKRRLVYASTPSSAAANGNRIAVIRPDTVEIIDWIPLPGEPHRLAIAKDATMLYVGLGRDSTSIAPIDLETRKAGTIFPIVDELSFGTCAMEVLPTNADALVVSKCGAVRSLELYVHGKPVSSLPIPFYPPRSIDFLDAQTFAGFDNYISPSSLGRYQVQGDQLVQLQTARSVVRQSSVLDHFRANGNSLYFSTGDIVDAQSMTIVGKLPATGWVQINAARNRIHFLSPIGLGGSTGDATPAIRTLEISTGNLTNETRIPDLGSLSSFIRWSDTGFAFLLGAPLYTDPLRSKVVFADTSGSGAMGPPVVASGGVVDAASFRPEALAPGSIISIFGSRLSMPIAQSSFLPLWTNLADTSVYVNGEPLPLYYVSPGQINAQLPAGIAPGTATLRVVSGRNVSAPVSLPVRSTAPAVFARPNGQASAQNQDGTMNSSSNPARPGTVLVVYCTGLGETRPSLMTGAASPFAPLAQAATSVTARVGGQLAEVLYAGMAPGFVGLGQVNIRVPALPPGSHGLELLTDGIASKAVSVSVGQ